MDDGFASPPIPMARPMSAPQPLSAPPRKLVPGIAQSIALSVIFYGVVIFVAVALEVLKQSGVLALDAASGLAFQLIIAWPVVIWICLRWSRTPFRDACLPRSFPMRIVPALLVASFGATILLLEMAGWVPQPKLAQEALGELAGGSKLTLFLPVVVLAPIAEELFFRGQILRGYLGRYSVTKSVWASAVLFAVFHLNPVQAVIALPLGLAYAWLVLRTGSVLPGMLSHAVVNFSTNYLLGPLAIGMGYSDAELAAMEHFPPAMLALGGAMIALGGFGLWRQLTPAVVPAAAALD